MAPSAYDAEAACDSASFKNTTHGRQITTDRSTGPSQFAFVPQSFETVTVAFCFQELDNSVCKGKEKVKLHYVLMS